MRAHATIVKDLDAELQAKYELPLSSFDVLVQLSLTQTGQMQLHKLADAVHLSRRALTRAVDGLEEQGLLERCRDPADSRRVFVAITEQRLERLAETTPAHLAGVRERFLDKLTSEQIANSLRSGAGYWESE